MNDKKSQTSVKQVKCNKQHRALPSMHVISNQEMKDVTGGNNGTLHHRAGGEPSVPVTLDRAGTRTCH